MSLYLSDAWHVSYYNRMILRSAGLIVRTNSLQSSNSPTSSASALPGSTIATHLGPGLFLAVELLDEVAGDVAAAVVGRGLPVEGHRLLVGHLGHQRSLRPARLVCQTPCTPELVGQRMIGIGVLTERVVLLGQLSDII